MKKYKRPTLCSNKLLFPSFTFYVGFMLIFIFNFLLSLALRFYCFLSLGRDYVRFYCFFIFGMWLCFDSIVFLSWDVITLWFYCFYLWDVIMLWFYCFFIWDVIILRFYYHVNFFYCNFISLVLLFFSLNFSFFQLFSSFLFFDGSPIDKYSYLFIFYKIIISKITIKKNE